MRRPEREAALRATERISALNHLVSHLEYLIDDRDRRPGGLNSAPPPGTADRWSPRDPVSALVVRPGAARAVHVLGLLAAGSLLLPGTAVTRCAASSVLVAIRVATARVNQLGSDGADRIGLLTSVVTAVARAGSRRPGVVDACLWFLAVTGVHGYAVSGWAKLLSPPWRDGSALLGVLRTATHGHRRLFAVARRYPVATRVATLAVAVVESAAPLVLVGAGRRLAWLYVGAGAGFHVGTAYVMGLNRFPAAFGALYPGLLYSTAPQRAAGRSGARDDLMVPVLLAVGCAGLGGLVLAGRRARRAVAQGRPGDTWTTSAGGRELRTRRIGPDRPDVPVVVLVHGAGETLEHWDVVADRLAGRAAVLSYDRPGHGGSAPGQGRDPDEAVAELAELVDTHAGDRDVVLVGRSTGAYLAWCAAARTKRPVHALVLVDAVYPDDLRASRRGAVGARAERMARTTAAWVRCGFAPLAERPPWFDSVPVDLRRLVLAQQRHPALWSASLREAETVGSAPAPPVPPTAGHVVLVSAGPPKSGTHAAEVLAAHPGARHVSLPGPVGPRPLWRDDDVDPVVAVLQGLLRSGESSP